MKMRSSRSAEIDFPPDLFSLFTLFTLNVCSRSGTILKSLSCFWCFWCPCATRERNDCLVIRVERHSSLNSFYSTNSLGTQYHSISSHISNHMNTSNQPKRCPRGSSTRTHHRALHNSLRSHGGHLELILAQNSTILHLGKVGRLFQEFLLLVKVDSGRVPITFKRLGVACEMSARRIEHRKAERARQPCLTISRTLHSQARCVVLESPVFSDVLERMIDTAESHRGRSGVLIRALHVIVELHEIHGLLLILHEIGH